MPNGRKRKVPSLVGTGDITRFGTVLPKRTKKEETYHKQVPVSTKRATEINVKKIKKLENKVNGKLQMGYHLLPVRNTPIGFNWSTGVPLLICLNDFYTNDAEFGSAAGSGSAYYPTFQAVPGQSYNTTLPAVAARWQDFKPNQNANLAPEFQQWKDVSLQQPEKSGYQPVYTDLRFCVKRTTCTPAQGDLWIRLDIFHAKKFFIPQSQAVDSKVYNMPAALGSLTNMAIQDVGNLRNSFNPEIWRTKTRWIKMKACELSQNDLMTVFHVRTKFPKKFLRLNMNVDATTNQGEEFWTMVDPKTPKWLLVSISNNAAPGNTTPELTITRKVVWRDDNL